VNGKDVYLHAGGAIGANGPSAELNLRLPSALKHYQLHPAAGAEELKRAVQASLRLLDLAPASISFSLLAATYLAVVKQADFSGHLTGESGGFKSELTALFQQHFGSGMDRKNLPAAWSSTGNALEMTAFHAKDAILVIDDFAPQPSQADASRLHAAAERVFRAAGNHAARGRLDSNAQLREPKPPRAMILSTGEETPRGHSIRARLFILELKKGAIDGQDLAVCQRDASIGLYAQSMTGFVQRLAGNRDEIVARFDAKVLDYRSQSISGGAHARTPEIVAHLRSAFDLVLEYAEDVGAIDAADAVQLAQRCASALREAAAAQAKHQGETEPTARFLTLLCSALFSGRAHLADREGGRPPIHPEACGWRPNESGGFIPSGDCVGWVDGDNLYLDLTAAYRVAQVLGRDSAEGISVGEQTLKKRLHDKKLLASIDEKRETLTVRRILAGTSKSVLHFLRTAVLPEASDGDEDAQ
jgi:hypothetical protein